MFFKKPSRSSNSSKNNEDLFPKLDKENLLPKEMDKTIEQIQITLGNSPDMRIHRFRIIDSLNCSLLYLKSFTDVKELEESILGPLLQLKTPPQDMQSLAVQLPKADTQEIISLEESCRSLAWGDVVLLISGFKSALKIPLKKYEQRVVTEPDNEKVVRGPRDCFLESLWTNIGLLRQRIKNANFRLEIITLGTKTCTEVGIVYVEGVANRQILEEVRRRVQKINVDRVLTGNTVAEMIQDDAWSPFPLAQITERPDRLAHHLLDGRIGIMVDGEPIVHVVPTVFWDFLKAADDYIESGYFITFVRLLRYLSHLITLLLPGAYVALTTIHLQMLPQSLAVIVAGARTRTPFPVSIELLLMELMVEVLREAGLRMPGTFGQTISVVGALVIGEAGVTAGLIEPIVVVVVAFTTLASFIVPSYHAALAVRMLRFPLILLSSFLGFFGLVLGAMFYLFYLVNLRSFGIPYFAPMAPLFLKDMKDLLVRFPWWSLSQRPAVYRPEDRISQGQNQKPEPEKE